MLFLNKLESYARFQPKKEALISESSQINYSELIEIVRKGAQYLQTYGIKSSDVVGISVENEVSHIILSLCLLSLGLRQVTLATHDTPESRKNLAIRSGVSVLISDGSINDLFSIIEVTNSIFWPDLNDLACYAFSIDQLDNKNGFIYLNTSGTTGDSNLIVLSEQQISQQAARHNDYANERFLRLATVEYNTSKRHRLYSLWNGGTNLFRPQGSLAWVIEFALKNNVSCIDISRMHISELISMSIPSSLANIKFRPGGSEVPAELRNLFIHQVSPNLFVRYATTETGGISIAGPNDHDEDATAGLPLPGVIIQIVTDNEKPCSIGELGEIRIKAEGMATSYLDNIEYSQNRFRNGWFYPGDMGYLRSDGQLVIKCRKDDMINLNGINIFPVDIERVLEQHPDVAAAAAFAMESDVHGQIPVAAVQLRKESENMEHEFITYSREQLGLRYPRRVFIVDEIPKNSQGKLLRKELKKIFNNKKNY